MSWSEATRRTMLDSFGGAPGLPIVTRLRRARGRTIVAGLAVTSLTVILVGLGAANWAAPAHESTPAVSSSGRSTDAARAATSQAPPTRRQTVAVQTGAIAATVDLDGR